MIDVFEKRDHCPSCNAETADAVPAVASRPPAESLTSSQLGPFLSGYTLHRVFFTYHRCGRCNTLYCPMYFNEEHLSRLYRDQPENMGEAPVEARAKTQEHYVQILQRYADGGIWSSGPTWACSSTCVPRGRSLLVLLGRPKAFTCSGHSAQAALHPAPLTPQATCRTAASPPVMIHVLDHVLNPRQLLGAIFGTPEPGGVLFGDPAESVLA
jgi:hypothetical protein